MALLEVEHLNKSFGATSVLTEKKLDYFKV